MKPIIGIAAWSEIYRGQRSHEINGLFARALERAGSIPLILPIVKDREIAKKYLDIIDGLLLIGGKDLSPIWYGEASLFYTDIDLERDQVEMQLLDLALKRGTKVFGICRGMQLGASYYGSTIYQDIGSQRKGSIIHDNRGSSENYHMIDIDENSFLYDIFGKELLVNSYHHQAIKDLGPGLKATAWARDGIIEAIESNDGNFFGVQFHPEFTKHNYKFPLFYEYFVKDVRKSLKEKD